MEIKGYAFLRGQTRVRFLEGFDLASIIETRLNSHVDTTRNVYVLPMFVHYSDAEGRLEEPRLFIESFKANKAGLKLSRFARTYDITAHDVIVTKMKEGDGVFTYTFAYAERDRPLLLSEQEIASSKEFLGHPLLTAVHSHLLWREQKYQELYTLLERPIDYDHVDITYS